MIAPLAACVNVESAGTGADLPARPRQMRPAAARRLARSRPAAETADNPVMRTTAHILASAAVALALGAGATCLGQAPAGSTTSVDLGGYRLPLLREGSVLSRAVGDLAQDPDEKLWLFRPSKAEAGGLRRELVLLPSPVLEDMLRVMRLSPAPVEFEVTGRVFIYRGRNFLLPELAPTIVRLDLTPATSPEGAGSRANEPRPTNPPPARAPETAPNGVDRFVAPDDADDATVAEIERRLEERIGRAPARVPDAPSTRASATGADEAGADEAGRGIDRPTGLPERLVLRRGRLMRDPQSGSWLFIPAQASGTGDPSLEILPCLLLEKLELAARENESSPDVLLSGSVVAYEGRQYLLPSSFRRARGGRGIG